MNNEFQDSLALIQPLFEEELKQSIETCIEIANPYGYALMLGEDLNMAWPMAITNSELSLVDCDDDQINDIRYLPDEWVDWHYDDFSKFQSAYEVLYQSFAAKNTITDEHCYYTKDALDFMNALYEMYFNTIKKVKAEYSSIWYWVIWISDSDREIIKKSFFSLNTGRAIEEAKIYFE